MGLIKTGIKYGAIFGIAREGMKVLDHKSNGNNNNMNSGYSQQQQQQPIQNGFRDVNGYVHQSYCNGQCGNHCNDGMMQQQQQQYQGEAKKYFNKGDTLASY